MMTVAAATTWLQTHGLLTQVPEGHEIPEGVSIGHMIYTPHPEKGMTTPELRPRQIVVVYLRKGDWIVALRHEELPGKDALPGPIETRMILSTKQRDRQADGPVHTLTMPFGEAVEGDATPIEQAARPASGILPSYVVENDVVTDRKVTAWIARD